MSDQGWAAWLPPKAQREIAREDARETAEARRAEGERQAAAEEWRERNLAMAKADAEARGQEITAMQLATGQIRGRSLADIFADARRAADAQDARDAAQLRREGDGGRVHVEFVDDPVLHHGRGEVGLQLFNRARRFNDRIRARKALAAAEEREAIEIPLQRTVELKPRRDDSDSRRSDDAARRQYERACAEIGVSYR
jgi:hypothetical protein